MKFEINRDKLLPTLIKIGYVVEKRQTLPILSNLLIRLQEYKLELSATDLEVEVKTIESVKSGENGETTLHAKKFIDICKALPEGAKLSFEVLGDKGILRSLKSRFTLGVLPSRDYPNIEVGSPEHSIEIEESSLKDLIEKTSFSMAQQDVRYYLNGMLIEIEKGIVRAVATDGHRLALSVKQLDHQYDECFQLLIPRKGVTELGRLLDYSDKIVVFELGRNFTRFSIDETVFTSKLIDGKFPDYKRVLPKNCDKKALVNRENLKNALLRASILSSEKYKGIRMSFSGNVLKLQAHNPEQEEAEEELEIEYGYDHITIGFNVGYLLDIIGSTSCEELLFELSNSNNSAIVRDPENENSVYVVMPMRL